MKIRNKESFMLRSDSGEDDSEDEDVNCDNTNDDDNYEEDSLDEDCEKEFRYFFGYSNF
nr:9081_t:CDS:2 [Entrophospora candida]